MKLIEKVRDLSINPTKAPDQDLMAELSTIQERLNTGYTIDTYDTPHSVFAREINTDFSTYAEKVTPFAQRLADRNQSDLRDIDSSQRATLQPSGLIKRP